MSSNVRKQNRRARPVRFTETPLSVYDTDEWNPLESYDEAFDSNVTLDLDFVEGIAVETVNILKKYELSTLPPENPSRVEGEEVGDDRVDLSQSPPKLATGLVVQSTIMGMLTSWQDTFLSVLMWNFCEVTGTVPLHPGQSFTRARKIGKFQDLGFVDVPPLRILLDVSKGDMSHSSTAVGKATMLGSRSRTTRTEFSKDWHLASYLQDGLLRTSMSSEPKYLPQIMGGSGVRTAFANPKNLYLYVHAYRGGICQRIYGSATQELRQSLASLEKNQAEMPILCSRLRDRQEYLHGTYAEKIFIPTKMFREQFRGNLPDPLITSSGGSNLFASFENRLLRTRNLVTRTSAEREWEITSQIRSKLKARYETIPQLNAREAFERKRARQEYNGALNANVAFANLLERKGSLQDVIQLTNENFHVVTCGATHFTTWDAEWLFFGGKSENFSIEDLTSSEDLFLRTDVSEDESLRVGNIPLRPLIKNFKEVRTTTTVGMYQIGAGMYEWASDLTQRLVNLRNLVGRPLSSIDALSEYEKDPEWVNDDSLIISRCLRDTAGGGFTQAVILVSDDKRLGNQLSNTCNIQVIRIFARSWVNVMASRGLGLYENHTDLETVRTFLPERFAHTNFNHLYVDTGSLASALTEIDRVEVGGVYIKHNQRGSYSPEGRRSHHYQLQYVTGKGNYGYMTHVPVFKPRSFRKPGNLLSESDTRTSSVSASRSSQSQNWRRT